MAKIKTTAFMDAISGKVNGTVFSRNRGGAYVRSKGVIRFKPGSELSDSVNLTAPTVQSGSPQGASIAILTSLSKQWSSALTGDQRIAFNAAVDSFKKTDVFGDLRSPTGSQLFIRLNSVQKNAAQHRIDVTNPLALIDTPPVFLPIMPSVDDAVFQMVMGNSLATPDPVEPLVLLFAGMQTTMGTLTDERGILVEITKPMSAGISKPSESAFRQLWFDNMSNYGTGTYGGGYSLSSASVSDFMGAYTARFGVDLDIATNPSLIGAKVFVKLTTVSLTNGIKGQPQYFSCIIQEGNPM